MSDAVIIDNDADLITEAFKPLATLERGEGGQLVQNFASQDRVFGAQAVAVHRNEATVLQKLKVLGQAVGEDWFYRWPVTDKQGRTKWIEGPSIGEANDLARIYGNNEIDVRVIGETATHWTLAARFTDYETGFVMTRLFQQRKSQQSIKTSDQERQQDIAFQIGQSKAIRNVIVNALQTFANFAFEAARDSIVINVGRNLPKYRDKVSIRLKELGVDLARVEAMRGRTLGEWLAPDVAMTIGEIKSVSDGMAAADDMWPPQHAAGVGPKKPPEVAQDAPASTTAADQERTDDDSGIEETTVAFLEEVSDRLNEARSAADVKTIWNDMSVADKLRGDDLDIAEKVRARVLDTFTNKESDAAARSDAGADKPSSGAGQPSADAIQAPPAPDASAAAPDAVRVQVRKDFVARMLHLATRPKPLAGVADARAELIDSEAKDLWASDLNDDAFVKTVVDAAKGVLKGLRRESAESYLNSLAAKA